MAIIKRLRAAGCVFAEEEAALLVSSARDADELEAMVQRRVDGLPLEHVLGWVEFYGRRYAIAPGVFVPRPRTEALVRIAVECAGPGAVVLDLCCGSGAVGAALAAALGAAELHASDNDPAAVSVARQNLDPGGTVYSGDLYDPLPTTLRGRVDVMVVIAPYVPTLEIGMLPREARLHEPIGALDGGSDGLRVLRDVLRSAPEWLAPGGFLVTEVGEGQVAALLELVSAEGLGAEVIRDEELGTTVVLAHSHAS